MYQQLLLNVLFSAEPNDHLQKQLSQGKVINSLKHAFSSQQCMLLVRLPLANQRSAMTTRIFSAVAGLLRMNRPENVSWNTFQHCKKGSNARSV
jgi:hypothetical protein